MSVEIPAISVAVDADFVMTIDGHPAVSSDTVPVFNPATRDLLTTVPSATREQLDAAVEAAQAAFAPWAATDLSRRQAILSSIGDRLEAHAEEFMALLTAEQGKPRAMAEWEVYGSVAWFREIAKQSLPEEVVEDTDKRRVISRHTPLGIVAAIVPWNFPILLAVWKIAPALVTGNTMEPGARLPQGGARNNNACSVTHHSPARAKAVARGEPRC